MHIWYICMYNVRIMCVELLFSCDIKFLTLVIEFSSYQVFLVLLCYQTSLFVFVCLVSANSFYFSYTIDSHGLYPPLPITPILDQASVSSQGNSSSNIATTSRVQNILLFISSFTWNCLFERHIGCTSMWPRILTTRSLPPSIFNTWGLNSSISVSKLDIRIFFVTLSGVDESGWNGGPKLGIKLSYLHERSCPFIQSWWS